MTDPEPVDRPTATPFVAALAIFALVVIAIWLFNAFGRNEPSPQQQVATAAVAQNDALQRQNYADFRTGTCRAQSGVESEVLAQQKDSVAKRGDRFVDDVADVTVDGDMATAKVTYSFGKARDTKTDVEVSFVRQDGAWKVCTPGPR